MIRQQQSAGDNCISMPMFYLSLPYCISFEYSVVCSSAELSVHKLCFGVHWLVGDAWLEFSVIVRVSCYLLFTMVNNAFIVVLHLEVTMRPSTMNGGWLRNSKI